MKRYRLSTGVLEVVMIVIAIAYALPIFILVSTSIRPQSDGTSAFEWPHTFTFDNFVQAWQVANLPSAILNSVIVTVVSTALLVAFSALASQPLARVTAAWSRGAYFTFLAGLLVPFQLGMVSLYTTFRDLGLLGSIVPLIILYTGLLMPFSILLYTNFLRALPEDYEEAARLDGCGPLRAFALVTFPLLRPVTGTVAILDGIFIWNDFFSPLLYLSGTPTQTIPVALSTFLGQYGSQWNLVFAGLIIGAAPILIVFFFMQRTVFQGFAGGLKG